jgi:putative ABC transport system permease protein
MVTVAAGLLVRSYAALLSVDPGFRTRHLWTATVSPPDQPYEDEARRRDFERRVVTELRALPGVEDAATAFPMPMSGNRWVYAINLEGEPAPPPNRERSVRVRFVTEGYFATMGIPLLRGHDFSPSPPEDAPPTVVVSRAAADAY